MLTISRVLHAGYLFSNQKTQILFDPIFENPFSHNCFAFPAVQFDVEAIKKLKLSAVFISHYHDDHCSMESLNLIDKSTPIFIFCVDPEMVTLIRSLGFNSVHLLELNTAVVIGSFEVIPRRALDAGVDSLFQVKSGELNILNVVDSWIDEETLELLVSQGPWDMVLWPFQTLRELEVLAPYRIYDDKVEIPGEWLEQLKRLQPRFVVPSSCQFRHESWSWYNKSLFPITYAQFTKVVEQILPASRVVRLDPSVTVQLSESELHFRTPLSWVKLLDPEKVDYDYQPSQPPQDTAEIAKHFRELNDFETKVVTIFCQRGLLEKYQSLEPSEFFLSDKIWRLSLFDSFGNLLTFTYCVGSNKIELLSNFQGEPHWQTEIPAAKLYSALSEGEALTSLYLRVIPNDSRADILEDPLICCLYSSEFATYQKSQLRKLNIKIL